MCCMHAKNCLRTVKSWAELCVCVCVATFLEKRYVGLRNVFFSPIYTSHIHPVGRVLHSN